MKCFGVVIIALAVGWFVAEVIVSASWSIRIRERAYYCNDLTFRFDTFRDDVETHRKAGDELGPGWTWEAIIRQQEMHRHAYILIWSLVSTLLLYVGWRITRRSAYRKQPKKTS